MFRLHRNSLLNLEVASINTHVRSKGLRSDRRYSGLTTKIWNARDFEIEEMIGSGHFGKLYRATHISESEKEEHLQTVALKRFSKEKLTEEKEQGRRGVELLRREISLHSNLEHPHIVQFFGYFIDRSYVALVLEYAPRGDLLNHMNHIVEPLLRLEKTAFYLAQMITAIEYLQTLRIAHRDIKPENILVHEGDVVKLCDFGWAVQYNLEEPQRTLCGTPEYVPPEMLNGHPPAYQAFYVDLWALGVLAFELFYGDTPFGPECKNLAGRERSRVIFSKIQNFRGFTVLPTDNHQHYKDFVSKLLNVRPSQRLLPEEAFDHPFIRSVFSN